MLNDRREEQKIIEVVQAPILSPGRHCSPESRIPHIPDHFRVRSFPTWNSVLPDPELQSAVDVPHVPTAHGGLTEMTTIRFEQDHGVGTIVLANPPANRIGSQFAVDLRAAVHDASLSDSRVLVIRSDGPNFCMGGNVPEWPGKSADWFRTFIAECNSSFHAIEALRIPTVAVVRGGAIGGGFELALACEFLVAAEDATFFAVEIRSGNIPLAGGLQRLAERVGRARAVKLALLGEPFSGIIAGDLGIATLVVPEADLDETSRKLVDKLANGPTKAYAAARTLLKAWSAGGVAAADVMMLDVAIDLFGTEDTTKGILNSAKAIQAGVQTSPLTFLGR